MGFLTDIETNVLTNLDPVVNAFGAGLLTIFRPGFIIGFTIWITLIAYGVAFGKSDDGATYLFTKIGKIFLIGVIALYGWPSLNELFQAIQSGFVGSSTLASQLETKLWDPLVKSWSNLNAWFGNSVSSLSFYDLVKFLILLACYLILILIFGLTCLGVGLFAVIALAMFLIASSIFKVLLAIGPFFLLCLSFPFTQRFFENYVGAVMTSIFAMGLIVLMTLFVSDIFFLQNIDTVIPSTGNPSTFVEEFKSLAVLFISKFLTGLLLIYMVYKIFDLASTLGGGLSMGNNLVGGVRNILKDMQRLSSGSARVNTQNTINQGATSVNRGGSSQRSSRPSSTFTGMAISAGPAAARMAYGATASIASSASSVARFAYNRMSRRS